MQAELHPHSTCPIVNSNQSFHQSIPTLVLAYPHSDQYSFQRAKEPVNWDSKLDTAEGALFTINLK